MNSNSQIEEHDDGMLRVPTTTKSQAVNGSHDTEPMISSESGNNNGQSVLGGDSSFSFRLTVGNHLRQPGNDNLESTVQSAPMHSGGGKNQNVGSDGREANQVLSDINKRVYLKDNYYNLTTPGAYSSASPSPTSLPALLKDTVSTCQQQAEAMRHEMESALRNVIAETLKNSEEDQGLGQELEEALHGPASHLQSELQRHRSEWHRLQEQAINMREQISSLETLRERLAPSRIDAEKALESWKERDRERRSEEEQERRYYESWRGRESKRVLQQEAQHLERQGIHDAGANGGQLQNSMVTVKNRDIQLKRPGWDMRNDLRNRTDAQEEARNASPEDDSVLADRSDSLTQTKSHNLSHIDLKSRSARSKNSPERMVPNTSAPNLPRSIVQQPPPPNSGHPLHHNFTTFNQDQDSSSLIRPRGSGQGRNQQHQTSNLPPFTMSSKHLHAPSTALPIPMPPHAVSQQQPYSNTVAMPWMSDMNGTDQNRDYQQAGIESDAHLRQDEENVDLEEADELNSDRGSSATIAMQQQQQEKHRKRSNPGNNIDDVKTGKFNQMMNQIIGEFGADDEENEEDDPAAASNVEQAMKSEDRWNRSSIGQSTQNLPPHNLSHLSNQYLSLPTSNANAMAYGLPAVATSVALQPTDPVVSAVNEFYNQTVSQPLTLPHGSTACVPEQQLNQIHLDYVYLTAKISHLKQQLESTDKQIQDVQRSIEFLEKQEELLQTIRQIDVQQKTKVKQDKENIESTIKSSVNETVEASRINMMKLSEAVQKFTQFDDMLTLKEKQWEQELRNLQDVCQKRQFQVDHLKREMAELMISHTDPSKQANSNRAIVEKHHQQKQEAAQKNFQTLLQNETFHSLGILQRQISKLYNKILERNKVSIEKQFRMHAGDGPSRFEERNNEINEDDTDLGALSQAGSKLAHRIQSITSDRYDLPELDFIEVFPLGIADGTKSVTQESINQTRQNMKRKTIQIDQAAQILSDICTENRRLSEVIESISTMSLKNYFELSRILRMELSHGELDEGQQAQIQKEIKKIFNRKIKDSIEELRHIQIKGQKQSRDEYGADGDELSLRTQDLDQHSSITGAVSNVSNYYQSEYVSFSLKYVSRFNELINEARGMFVADLSTLQQEISNSRKLLIQVHRKAEGKKKENHSLSEDNAKLATKLHILQETYEELLKKKEKTAVQVSKLEGENQSYQLQIEKLEMITNNKEKQIFKMMEEIKSYQAQISKTEQIVFDHQTEIQRKKAQIAEQQQSLAGNSEETRDLKEQIASLNKEIQNLKAQQLNKQMEALLKELSNWITECKSYNENFLENQDFINQLQMTIDEPGSGSWGEEDQSERIIFDVVNIEEVVKIVRKINQHAAKFEPTRTRMKQNFYMIRKKINEFLKHAQNMRKNNKRAQINSRNQNSESRSGSQDYLSNKSWLADRELRSPSPNKKLRTQEIDNSKSKYQVNSKRKLQVKTSLSNRGRNNLEEYLDIDDLSANERMEAARGARLEDQDDDQFANDDIRMRLDFCLEENGELQRKLKQQNVKVQKLDDLNIKFEGQSEAFKMLRKRFCILVEKLKNLHEQHPDTWLAEEMKKLLRKMSTLPPIQQLHVSYLPSKDSSLNRKSSNQGGLIKSQMEAPFDNASQFDGKMAGSEYHTLTEAAIWNEKMDMNRTKRSTEQRTRKRDRPGDGSKHDNGLENRSVDLLATRHWSFGADAEQKIALALQIQKDAIKRSSQATQTDAIRTSDASCQFDGDNISLYSYQRQQELVQTDDLTLFIQNQNEMLSCLKNIGKESNTISDTNQFQSNGRANLLNVPFKGRTIQNSQNGHAEEGGVIDDDKVEVHDALESSNFQSQGCARGASPLITPVDEREQSHLPVNRASFNSTNLKQESQSIQFNEGDIIIKKIQTQSGKLASSPISEQREDDYQKTQAINKISFAIVNNNEINQSTQEKNSQHEGNEDSLINAIEVTLPNRDRSRTSIQILDQAVVMNPPHIEQQQFNNAEHDAPPMQNSGMLQQHLMVESQELKASTSLDQNIDDYEQKFDEIQREMNALEEKRNESNVIVDAQKLQQQLNMACTDYSEQTFDDEQQEEEPDNQVQWQQQLNSGQPRPLQDMLIIEEQRRDDDSEREGQEEEQVDGRDEDDNEQANLEEQYDFTDGDMQEQAVQHQPSQMAQHQPMHSNGSANLPEDRENFFQIDENDEEPGPSGEDFQLDDFAEAYGNQQYGDNLQMNDPAANRFGGINPGMLYQQRLPETIQEELEGEGESNFGSRDYQNLNVSKASRISKLSAGQSHSQANPNISQTPRSHLDGEGGQPSNMSEYSQSHTTGGSKSKKKSARRAKYANNSKYLSKNAKMKSLHQPVESMISEQEVDIMSSAIISQQHKDDAIQQEEMAMHSSHPSRTDSLSQTPDHLMKPSSTRSSHLETAAMINMTQALQQDEAILSGRPQGQERSTPDHQGSSHIHNVSPHSLESGRQMTFSDNQHTAGARQPASAAIPRNKIINLGSSPRPPVE